MKKRMLGKSKIMVSALGLGCMRVNPDPWYLPDGKPIDMPCVEEKEIIRMLHAAFDMGVNLLDTAIIYGSGQNEVVVGKAVRGRRDKTVIVTKFPIGIDIDEPTRRFKPIPPPTADTVRAHIRAHCEGSLRRLATDYLDVFMNHEPTAKYGPEMRDALEELVVEGKIRSYAWCTTSDNPEQIEAFADGKRCSTIQFILNVLHGNYSILSLCERKKLAAMIIAPLGEGLLAGKRTSNRTGDGDVAAKMKKVEAIRDILTSGGRTLHQGALCWIWARSPITVPVPGFTRMEHVVDNCGALKHAPLSKAQMDEIARLVSCAKSGDSH